MKKKIIIVLTVIALMLSFGLISNAGGGSCEGCKDDGYCDNADPTQGFACNYGGDGNSCSMYYTCAIPE